MQNYFFMKYYHYLLDSFIELEPENISTVVGRACYLAESKANYRVPMGKHPALVHYSSKKSNKNWDTSLLFHCDETQTDVLFFALGSIGHIRNNNLVNMATRTYDLKFMTDSENDEEETRQTLLCAIQKLRENNLHLSCVPASKTIIRSPACIRHNYKAIVTGFIPSILEKKISCIEPLYTLQEKDTTFFYRMAAAESF